MDLAVRGLAALLRLHVVPTAKPILRGFAEATKVVAKIGPGRKFVVLPSVCHIVIAIAAHSLLSGPINPRAMEMPIEMTSMTSARLRGF